MLSAILHLILAFLTAVGAWATYAIWKREEFGEKPIRYFFIFYIFFIAYHLFLSFPFLFLPENLPLAAAGYIAAIASIFLMVAATYRFELYLLGASATVSRRIITFVLFAGLAAVLLLIIYFRLPVVGGSGLIIWNNNLLSGWITVVVVGLSPFSWVIIFLKNWPARLGFTDKLKSFFLIVGALAFTSACVYFVARSLWAVIAAFVLVGIGTIFFTGAFLLPAKKLTESQELADHD